MSIQKLQWQQLVLDAERTGAGGDPFNNPEQAAIPCPIMQYKLLDLPVPTEMNEFEHFCASLASDKMSLRITLTPFGDVFKGYCAQEYHFRIAESQFLRMSSEKNLKASSNCSSTWLLLDLALSCMF